MVDKDIGHACSAIRVIWLFATKEAVSLRLNGCLAVKLEFSRPRIARENPEFLLCHALAYCERSYVDHRERVVHVDGSRLPSSPNGF